MTLASEQKMSGSYSAEVFVRPTRVVVVVPDDAEIFANAVMAACMTWSGRATVFIPTNVTGDLDEVWIHVANQYDPDIIVDYAGLTPKDSARLTAFGATVSDQRTDPQPILSGTSIFSVLNRWTAPDHKKRADVFVAEPDLEPSDPRYLSFLTLFGKARNQVETPEHSRRNWTDRIEYDQFVQRVKGSIGSDWSGSGHYFATSDPPNIANASLPTGISHTSTPINMTMTGVVWTASMAPIGGARWPDQPDEAYANQLVVAGAPDSIPDLCLYWNLRAIRGDRVSPYPVWVPLGVFPVGEELEMLRLAKGRHAFHNPREARDQATHVLSMTADMPELANRWNSEELTVNPAGEIERYFLQPTYYYAIRRQVGVQVTDGDMHVQISSKDATDGFASDEMYSADIKIEGVAFPRSSTFRSALFGHVGTRVTRQGYLSYDFWTDPGEPVLHVNLPSTWKFLESVFDQAGYDVMPSDKGLTAAGLIRQLGSYEDVSLLRNKGTYDLLKEFSENKGAAKARIYVGERRPFSFHDASRYLGHDTSEVIQKLIQKNVILRGLDVRCQHCRMTSWQGIDALSREWRCAGCTSLQVIDLPPEKANWKYVVSSLVAHAFDQGAMLHVLLANWRSHLTFDSGLIFYPGVLAQARDVSEPIQNIEIDLVMLSNGRPSLAECKEPGSEFDHDQINRLLKLSELLGCRSFTIATTGEIASADLEYMENHDSQVLFESIEGEEIWGDGRPVER